MAGLFEIIDVAEEVGGDIEGAVIKVVGVGSGGVNAVNTMINQKVKGVEYIAMNTDSQHLKESLAEVRLTLNGPTGGRGAGCNPARGEEAAVQETDRIREFLTGADMVVLATGLGGGTGTGATPVVAQIAKEMGILTIAVVTKPFSWEGPYKIGQAQDGLDRLRDFVDAYVVIPNDKMKKITPKGTPTKQAFALIDQMLCDAMSGVVELISRPGYINRDFEDVRAVLQDAGLCLFGVGIGEGDERAMQALEKAIRNPLLEDTPIEGARKILVNVVQGPTGTPDELELICEKIKESLAVGGMMTHGWSMDERLGEKCKVTIIASDLGHAEDVIPENMVELGSGSSRSNRGGYSHSQYDGRPVVVAEPHDPYATSPRRPMLPSTAINHSANQETRISHPVDGDSELDPVPAFMRVGESRNPLTKRLF